MKTLIPKKAAPKLSEPKKLAGSRGLRPTPAQEQAIKHTGGPLLIIAGAGTGKTAVITQRVAYLMRERGLTGDQILAVTFTNKATEELEQRLDLLMPYGYLTPWISTFHGFGEKILRAEGLALGLDTDFTVATPAAQQMLIKKNLSKFDLAYYKPLGNPTKFVGALVSLFNRAKDEGVDAKKYLAWAQTKEQELLRLDKKDADYEEVAAEVARQLELARAFKIYEKLMQSEGLVDVADLIALTLKLFKRRPNVLAKYKKQFKAILVDEFQDTNYSQYQLIKLLSDQKSELTVVADDDQAIYRWRGASVANVLLFMEDYSNAKKVALRDNFRSTQEILDKAYLAIGHNNPDRLEKQLSISKKLVAARGQGVEPIHYQAATLDQEVAHIVQGILTRKNSGRNWSDFAVLVRSNAAARPIIAALETQKVPYYFMTPEGLFSQPVIMDLVAFLRVLADVRDSVSLFRLLKSPLIKMPALDLLLLNHEARKNNLSLFETLFKAADFELSSPGEQAAGLAQKLIKKYAQLSAQKSAAVVLYEFVDEIKLLEKLLKKENKNNQEQILNINSFFKQLFAWERETQDKSIPALIEYLDLLAQTGEQFKEAKLGGSPDSVKIMTVHGAKGLEFPVVFLANLAHNYFPSINRREPIELPVELVDEQHAKLFAGDVRLLHLQEERRLFYVACTRARDELILTSSIDHGGARKNKPSRFIKEATIPTIDAPEITLQKMMQRKKSEQVAQPIELPLPKKFSYTQLTVFETCPLQYKFAHLYKIPSPGNHVFSYGKSLHETLAAFYRLIQRDQPPPSKEQLLELLEKNWISEWYLSKKDERERKEVARDSLSKYYDDNELKLSPPLWIEQAYNLRVGPHTLIGRIDRADELADGTLEIIDYKTGKFKDAKKMAHNDQLAIYALAAQKVFNKKASKLTWYFLDEGKKVTSTRTPEQLATLEKDLIKKIDEIKKSDFPNKAGFACRFCDFKNICEAGQKQ